MKDPQNLKNFLELLKVLPDKLREIVPGLEQESDAELQQIQEVYLNIAQFLHEKFDLEKSICLAATYILCNELDSRLKGENKPNQATNKLVAAAREVILTIKVHYEQLKQADKYERKTEIFFVNRNENKPSIFRISEQVDWEKISPDVRDSFIRDGKEIISFKLYPQES